MMLQSKSYTPRQRSTYQNWAAERCNPGVTLLMWYASWVELSRPIPRLVRVSPFDNSPIEFERMRETIPGKSQDKQAR